MRLKGKVSIVTGAASGIGRACSLEFAQQGSNVAVVDINDSAGLETVAAVEAAGGDALYLHCDVSDADEVRGMIRAVADRHGRIDVLLNNAAYLRGFSSVTESDDDEWDRAIRTTLTGVYLCSKYALPRIIESGGGSIISMASVGGIVAFKDNAAYCAAKAGVIMLMKSIAADYGSRGVRANAIAPGAIDTPLNDRYRDDADVQAMWARKSLVGRPLAAPSEVAAAAVFLASDEASFVTGATLPVDGGWTAT